MSILSVLPSADELTREAHQWLESGFHGQRERFIAHVKDLTRLRFMERGAFVAMQDHEAATLDLTHELGELADREVAVAEQLRGTPVALGPLLVGCGRLIGMGLLLLTDVGVMVLVCADYLGIDTQQGVFADPLPGFIALSLGTGLTFLTVLLAEGALGTWDRNPAYLAARKAGPGRLLPTAALLVMSAGLAVLRNDQSGGSWFFSVLGVLALPLAAAALRVKFGIGRADTSAICGWFRGHSERQGLRREARGLRRTRREVVREQERVGREAAEAARGREIIEKAMSIVQTRAELAFEKAAAHPRFRQQEGARGPARPAPYPRRIGLS